MTAEFFAFINNFRWNDVVDILAVAFIAYQVLLFLADTRAMQIVRGVFIIAIFGMAAQALRLHTITWLLNRLLAAVLIGIPIVFQPELRSLLETIGRGRLIAGHSKVNDVADEYVDGLVEAIAYLQQHRIGALIIFQKNTGLREIWRSAVQIRAEITKELILSIFWPNSPLHDGAVILDRQSIIAASCYLPLTDKDDISRWHGTRHRAAVGVTEVSDAQALVVSEERGQVSLAIKGRLSRPLNEDQIARFARRYFKPFEKSPGPLQTLRGEMASRWPGEGR
jgi:diadenylate cyclase